MFIQKTHTFNLDEIDGSCYTELQLSVTVFTHLQYLQPYSFNPVDEHCNNHKQSWEQSTKSLFKKKFH